MMALFKKILATQQFWFAKQQPQKPRRTFGVVSLTAALD